MWRVAEVLVTHACDGPATGGSGGAAMPSRLTADLGPQSSAIDANAVMWSFFVAHSLSS
jgi:hypothetical protein